MSHVLELVDDYLHDLLSPADARALQEHCERCPTCQAALAEAKKRFEALKTIPPSEASEKLISQTLETIAMHQTRRARGWKTFGWSVLLATAAAVLVIGGVNAYYYTLAPSPYEVRLLGQSELLTGTNAGLRVAVFDHRSGQGVSNVEVEISLVDRATKKSVTLANLRTDRLGFISPQLELPDWKDGSYELRVAAKPAGVEEVVSRPIQLKRAWKLMLTSDKPVYQPGQTIHVRSLALRRPDLKPVSGQNVTLTIADPAGNVIFKRSDVTTKFGLAWADCELATEILEGAYHVECRVGDVTTQQNVKVEKYVLPKFKLAIELDKPFYLPGQQVSGTLSADYFFGQPVAGGQVEIEARGADVESFLIERIVDRKTDDQGKLAFSFRLPETMVGLEQEAGKARVRVVAKLTDSAAQSYATGVTRNVTSEPIDLEIIPEGGSLVKDVANTIYVYASYADGRPARVKLVVSGSEEELSTNDLGVASWQITPQENFVAVNVKATDPIGQTGRKSATFTCGGVAGDFLIRTDKAVYDGGDTLALSALGGGVEPVFVDFVKDGQSLVSQTIEMTGRSGEAEFDLPPEVFGTVKVVAYRFGAAGVPVRKSRLIFVRQARELKLDVTFDQPEYRPGDKAKLRFQLTDPAGKPTPGAISLAVVDEAVFSVLDQHSGMERVFFLLEEELLRPVYAVYDRWLPDNTEPNERGEFDQALFSTTATSVSGYNAIPSDFLGRNGVAVPDPDFARMELPPMEVKPDPSQSRAEDRTPFTLAANNFPAKVARVDKQRRDGMYGVALAWTMLIACLVMAGVVAFAIYSPRAFIITGAILGVVMLVGAPLLLLATFYLLGRAGFETFAGAKAAMEGDFFPAGEGFPRTGEQTAQGVPLRVRQFFPETLVWQPNLITDEQGQATLDIDPLADSITTWRLTASAVSAEGGLGSLQRPIKVFQPFFVDLNLPVALTRHDEVSIPVVVYNYLDQPQTVELKLELADWFTLNGPVEGDGSTQTIELKPNEVRSLSFPLTVNKVGTFDFQVTARAGDVADAIKRQIEVVPNGRRVEESHSGSLGEPAEFTLRVPENTIPGSVRAIVKLHPSAFSQVVEGLDSIFQMPHGCFEQTSSTTYPNVLALDYLRKIKKNAPAVEARSRQYIHVGYQRLISFEVAGGGFDWFGRAPANQTLTAYGLLEFEDMAAVHDVDPNLIARTRSWLLAQRQPNGSWKGNRNMLNDGLAGSVQRGSNVDLATTAYVAWAAFGGGKAPDQAAPTLAWLTAHKAESLDDPYVVALVAAAVAGIDQQHPSLAGYLDRLDALKQSTPGDKLVWWKQPAGSETMFHGSGRSGDIEATAMATLALLKSGRNTATTRGALAWLVQQKDPQGTWHSTQATVLALKALLAGTGTSPGDEKERLIEISLGGEVIRKVSIPPDQADVMQQLDLSSQFTGGEYRLALVERTDAGTGYQVLLRYHVDETAAPLENNAQPAQDPLTINIAYDRERLRVDDTVTAVATVVNNLPEEAPMVILDLPIPGGFIMEPGELDELKGSGLIGRYQITTRKAIVYLRALAPGQKLELRYRLKATMPVKVAVPPARAYEYYNPDRKGSGGAARLEAVEA